LRIEVGSKPTRIFAAPMLQAALLFGIRGAGRTILRNNSGLEVICQRKDQMSPAGESMTSEPLPQIIWEPAAQIGKSLSRSRPPALHAFAMVRARAPCLHR